ncbi:MULTISPECIES: lactate utilization protein [Desulfosporosinus]|uniref:LUD domain-containing protein n=1 Tax=Desulfosporosinus acididurans TaxID=476652 RepID=A0A0J1FN56_9FIRM|nr:MULTISPECIES: lactate utilization protein [Desulfosporosinus]KLU64393.1 hypothetical protein DEAC_c35950 [Desulfosporosinus acididurans]
MEINEWHNETIGRKAVEALKKNEFDAVYFATAEEAAAFIMNHVKPEMTVGFGGSMTIKNMGIQDKVNAVGGKVLDHGAPGIAPEEKIAISRQEMLSDLYLCSSNAITLDGMLVNVDGLGNRVAAMSFGPKKVIIAAGVNKLCQNEAAAFARLEGIAAPMNNKRLDTPNPCTKSGVCVNCQSPTRICRVYSVMRKKPMAADITVLIIGDSCGY